MGEKRPPGGMDGAEMAIVLECLADNCGCADLDAVPEGNMERAVLYIYWAAEALTAKKLPPLRNKLPSHD